MSEVVLSQVIISSMGEVVLFWSNSFLRYHNGWGGIISSNYFLRTPVKYDIKQPINMQGWELSITCKTTH